jgi:hypothetical protein
MGSLILSRSFHVGLENPDKELEAEDGSSAGGESSDSEPDEDDDDEENDDANTIGMVPMAGQSEKRGRIELEKTDIDLICCSFADILNAKSDASNVGPCLPFICPAACLVLTFLTSTGTAILLARVSRYAFNMSHPSWCTDIQYLCRTSE